MQQQIEASKPKKLNNIKKCYRWKESSVETYQKTIRQQQIQSLFLDKTFHCDSEGVNWAGESLNSLFDLSASLSTKKIKQKPQKINKWFDEECKKPKKEIEKPVQPKT